MKIFFNFEVLGNFGKWPFLSIYPTVAKSDWDFRVSPLLSNVSRFIYVSQPRKQSFPTNIESSEAFIADIAGLYIYILIYLTSDRSLKGPRRRAYIL
jgi:hypothetical protein